MPLDLPDDQREAFLRTADAPPVVLDLLGLMTAHAVVTALRLGVFDALADGPCPAAELAGRIGADPYGLAVLLDTLTEVGYLESAGDAYANTPAAARWLAGGGHWGAVLSLWVAMVQGQWSDLEHSVRTGTPAAGFYPWLDRNPAERERFHDLQRGLATGLAAEVVELADLPDGARSLLDVGGGEANYSIAFCARHPELTATVLDRPSVGPAGKERIAAAGLADRIAMRDADLTDGLGERGYDAVDVVLLGNVVHGFAPERARALVAESVRALRPGGLLLLLETADRPHDDSVPLTERAFNRFFDLHLWHTQAGRVYPVPTLVDWLTEAGCTSVRRTDLPRHPSHTLLAATR
ncbi:MAG TPA: methyltransferase dimerization domain-containing protein [Pseudonocardia sp.]|nr:methyltransferase dimerization domain-containing protein [Pseudonocardia sp.]